MKVAKIDVLSVMTSKEIAELTGSTHDNVLKTIRKLIVEGVVSGNETTYVNQQNKQPYPQYILDFRNTMVVVSGYNADLRARIIDRWQELEAQQSTRIEEEQTRLRDRQTARLECHDLTKAIEDRYSRRGTKPATYNFSNEFNMINKIVLGETAKKFKESHGLDPNAMLRDYLSAIEIKAVLDLQATSRVLCDLDFNYDQRKEKLTKLFDQKYRDAMLAEIIRLES
jgi:phage regulator Rha-like protein